MRFHNYGRIEDSPKFVDSLLDSYDKQNLLTWQGALFHKMKFGLR